MKLKILSAIAITGLAASAFGQQVILDNLSNSGGLAATSGGQVYENGVLFDGNNYNLGVTVWGGSSVGSLAVLGTFTPATDAKGYTGAALGQFQLGAAFAAVALPGVSAGGPGFVELQIWDYDSTHSTGTYASYAAALAASDPVGSAIFANPVSNPSAGPPVPAGDLTGMPSVNLLAVATPEPTTFAIAGLGLASLLAIRRRK